MPARRGWLLAFAKQLTLRKAIQAGTSHRRNDLDRGHFRPMTQHSPKELAVGRRLTDVGTRSQRTQDMEESL